MEKTIEKFKRELEDKLRSIGFQIYLDYKVKTTVNLFMDKNISEEKNNEKVSKLLNEQYSKSGYYNEIAKISVIKVLLNILNNPKENWQNDFSVFYDYEILSQIFNDTDLNMQEKFKVVKFILLQNLCNYNDNSIVIEREAFDELNVSSLTKDEFEQYLRYEASDIINTKDSELNEKKLAFKNAIKEIIKKYPQKNSTVTVFSIIKRHYIDKLNTYTETDARITTKAFQFLGIDKDLCEGFENLMKNEIRKRKDKEKVSLNKNNLVKEKEKQEQELSIKEHNKIYCEILNYYDIENHKIVKLLSLEEIIYVVSLLNKIKVSKNDIIKFIQNANKAGLMTYDNPITEFNEYYNKMVLYSNYPEINEALENILNYMQEIFIPESRSSYEFWKEEIANEFKKVKTILDRNYTYEYEEGMKK